ncbi:hypothetical protein [Geotalea toluenoxydans]|uniref:hypothetical protein n=1 Tax=Geotalea toluenoxydans TaxID=421624 RepID=UPI000B0BFC0F|nr:hypothetical protein [Geotalea toluenoxydans]
MAKKKGKGTNRRKSSGGKYRQLVTLLAVIVLIALAFFLLEQSRHTLPGKQERQGSLERQKMPARPVAKPGKHDVYTAAKARPVPQARTRPHLTGPGTVAIIIDDMGRSTREADSLLAINLPITFAVIPGYAKQGLLPKLPMAGEGRSWSTCPWSHRDTRRKRWKKTACCLGRVMNR